jgi:hypothetical protein
MIPMPNNPITVADEYALFLEQAGYRVFQYAGVNWYDYKGFLRPAYLPHKVPEISQSNAIGALRQSGCPFARWDAGFGSVSTSNWWHVIKRSGYCFDSLSGNTKSKIKRGSKRLEARRLTPSEVEHQGWSLFLNASRRFGSNQFMPTERFFRSQILAAIQHPNCFEYFGVFFGDKLVGLSENHLQSNGCLWDNIWYDPDHLGDYSSYLLTHSMLEYYLNGENYEFVSDGSRSIYHQTNVQTFFIDKFKFQPEYTNLHIAYSGVFGMLVRIAYPFRQQVKYFNRGNRFPILNKADAILRQHELAYSPEQPSEMQT